MSKKLSYYEKHKEAQKSKARKNYERTRKAKIASSRKYRRSHREYYLEYNKKYYREHPFTAYNKHQRLLVLLKREKVRRKDPLWNLNFYSELIKDNECHYCGSVLAPTGHSLDRMNNDLPHAANNVVPCCKDCNWTKNHHLSYDEMMLLSPVLHIIINKRKEKKVGKNNKWEEENGATTIHNS